MGNPTHKKTPPGSRSGSDRRITPNNGGAVYNRQDEPHEHHSGGSASWQSEGGRAFNTQNRPYAGPPQHTEPPQYPGPPQGAGTLSPGQEQHPPFPPLQQQHPPFPSLQQYSRPAHQWSSQHAQRWNNYGQDRFPFTNPSTNWDDHSNQHTRPPQGAGILHPEQRPHSRAVRQHTPQQAQASNGYGQDPFSYTNPPINWDERYAAEGLDDILVRVRTPPNHGQDIPMTREEYQPPTLGHAPMHRFVDSDPRDDPFPLNAARTSTRPRTTSFRPMYDEANQDERQFTQSRPDAAFDAQQQQQQPSRRRLHRRRRGDNASTSRSDTVYDDAYPDRGEAVSSYDYDDDYEDDDRLTTLPAGSRERREQWQALQEQHRREEGRRRRRREEEERRDRRRFD